MEAFLKKHEHSITTFSIVYSVSILLLYCFLSSLIPATADLPPNGQRGLTGLILYGICLAIGLTRKSHCLLRRLSVIAFVLSPLTLYPSIDMLIHPTSYLVLIANLPISGIFVLFLNYLRLNAHHVKPSLFFYGASIFFGGFCSALFFISIIATTALVACAMNFVNELRLILQWLYQAVYISHTNNSQQGAWFLFLIICIISIGALTGLLGASTFICLETRESSKLDEF